MPVDITATNTERLEVGYLLTDATVAYPLDQGVTRAQMRVQPSSVTPKFEWSTAAGTITLLPQAATASVQFTKNPAAGETLTVGETVITFVTSGATGLAVLIAGDLDGTLVTLQAALTASSDPDLGAQAYAVTDSRLDLVAKAPGIAGNGMALATSVTGANASAPSLQGGGTLLVLEAEVKDIGRFIGAYAYDVRFEGAGGPAVLFGGTITFIPGVTRTE